MWNSAQIRKCKFVCNATLSRCNSIATGRHFHITFHGPITVLWYPSAKLCRNHKRSRSLARCRISQKRDAHLIVCRLLYYTIYRRRAKFTDRARVLRPARPWRWLTLQILMWDRRVGPNDGVTQRPGCEGNSTRSFAGVCGGKNARHARPVVRFASLLSTDDVTRVYGHLNSQRRLIRADDTPVPPCAR